MLLKHRCVCVRVSSSTWHSGSVACTACTATSQQEGYGFDSHMGRCWLWGAGPPQSAQCSGGLSPGHFCVEFACSPRVHTGFPPLRTPTEKTCKITEHMAIPDQRWTVHFTWSPGATSRPLLLGGPGERIVQDGRKQKINSPRPQAYLRVCVCVSCVASIYARVFQCVVCAIKNLTKVLIIIIKLIFKETCNTNIFTFHGYFHCVKFHFDTSKGKNYIFEVYFCHALLAHISDC